MRNFCLSLDNSLSLHIIQEKKGGDMNEVRRIDLTVKQTELETGVAQIIYQGKALRVKNEAMYSLTYNESKTTEVLLEVYSDHLVLKRTGEALTTLTFNPAKKQTGSLSTTYGVISLDILTEQLRITSSRLRWMYRLNQGDELVGAYVSEWTLEETE